MCWNYFLINISLKKCVMKLLMISHQYQVLIPIGLLQSKRLKSIVLLSLQILIDSIWMNIFNNLAFNCSKMGILSNINLNNINLIIILMKMILILFFISDLLSWHTKFEKSKSLKKGISKELMPVFSFQKMR